MISISRWFPKVKCSSENVRKKTARVRQGIKEKNSKQKESTSIISVAGCELVVNAWQKKTSPRGAHRKGYDQ